MNFRPTFYNTLLALIYLFCALYTLFLLWRDPIARQTSHYIQVTLLAFLILGASYLTYRYRHLP